MERKNLRFTNRKNFLIKPKISPLKPSINSKKNNIPRESSPSTYITNSLDISTAFIGNISRTKYRRLAVFGLVLWIMDAVLCFAFDIYEAHKNYGVAWGIVKGSEWLVFCFGSYCVIRKTVPWIKEGLRRLENDYYGMNYGRSMFKITLSVKVGLNHYPGLPPCSVFSRWRTQCLPAYKNLFFKI